MRCFWAILVLVLGGSSAVLAEGVFRYTDSEGRVHYTTNAAEIPPKYAEQAAVKRELPPVSKVQSRAYSITMPADPLPSLGRKKVEIFVTRWCPYCKALEGFLKAQRVTYTKYDIEKDAAAEREYNRLGRPGVPVTKIGNEVLSGFDQADLLAALGRAR